MFYPIGSIHMVEIKGHKKYKVCRKVQSRSRCHSNVKLVSKFRHEFVNIKSVELTYDGLILDDKL